MYIHVASFAWVNANSEKITTEYKFENYGFFAQYYIILQVDLHR